MVDLLLNLRGVVIKLHNRDNAVLTLKKEGAGPVTAGDIRRHRTKLRSSIRSTSSPTSRRAANWSSRSRSNRAVVMCPATVRTAAGQTGNRKVRLVLRRIVQPGQACQLSG